MKASGTAFYSGKKGVPRIGPKGLVIKKRKNKSGIHYFCNSNHVTYLHSEGK